MDFCFASKVTWPKFEKPPFQRNFSIKLGSKLKKHEYIHIFEIKFEKILLFKNGGQNKFCDIAQ